MGRRGTGFKQALELNANNAEARCSYAILLVCLERPDEALVELRRAQAVDPLSPYAATLVGLSHAVAGRDEEAVAAYEQALELSPNFALAAWYLSASHLRMGRPEKALAVARSLPEAVARVPAHLAYLGAALGATGRVEEVRELLATLGGRERTEYVPPVIFAALHVAIGDRERAFEHLDRAYAERSPNLAAQRFPSAVDQLRDDPRYDALVRRMNFPPPPGTVPPDQPR